MELLEEIGRRPYGTGSRSFGLFICPVCKAKVEKSLSHGKRDKNCGSKECRKATFSANADVANNALTHGFSRDPHFRTFTRIYDQMKQRCYNEKHVAYSTYGGAGIEVGPEWNTLVKFAIDMFPSYKVLAELSDGTKSTRPSIDRIDPFSGYTKNNCEWITCAENSAKDKRIPVVRMDFNGNVLESYACMIDASNFVMPFGCKTIKASLSNIHDCCNGKRVEHLGYIWKFASSKIKMQKHSILE